MYTGMLTAMLIANRSAADSGRASHVAKSPHLLGICAFMLLHTITSTLV